MTQPPITRFLPQTPPWVGRSVYVDTSSAAGIQPHLLEYAVEKIGAEKILFGTVRVFASHTLPSSCQEVER